MNRKGFTLIELLIVVVIIGILAAIAIPKFANTKQKAMVASMKTDLKNLVTAQEAYFSDNNAYAANFAATQGVNTVAFTATQGNLLTISNASATGFQGTMINNSVTGVPSTCGVYVGATVPGPPAGMPAPNQEGAPLCW